MLFLLHIIAIGLARLAGIFADGLFITTIENIKVKMPIKFLTFSFSFLNGFVSILIASFIIYLFDIMPNAWLFLLMLLSYLGSNIKKIKSAYKDRGALKKLPILSEEELYIHTLSTEYIIKLTNINLVGNILGLIIGALLIY